MIKPIPPMRLIVGIAGASGVIYGIRALEILRQTGIETHLVMSPAAELTMSYETDVKPRPCAKWPTSITPSAMSARRFRRGRSRPWAC
jgi:3-polyprenyl-4-hydroxybenzoate decarboxylase